MIVFSKTGSPDIECRDGGQMEAAELQGYSRKGYISNKTEELILAPTPAGTILNTTIYQKYERKFGKKPHHLMKPENILKALED